jgi:large subunit ribosomal protein L25
MKTVPLTAFTRTLTRGPGAKRLRASGRIPAVVYGRHNPAQNLEIDSIAMRNLIHGSASENILVDLEVKEDSKSQHRLAMVKSVQRHPLSAQILHVDLHEVSEAEKVVVMVPVEAVGESVGVKQNAGVLEHVLFRVKVRGLPKDLPEVLEVDVSHLDIGQTIHLGDIKPPAGVELIGDKAISVLSVAAPISEAQELAELEAAAAAAGDVEMIKEKKEEGEEGAPAAAAAKPGEKLPAEKAAKGVAAKGVAEKAPAAEKAAPVAGAKPGAKPAEKKPERKK